MPEYRAFISYRHRPLDIAAAKAVQSKLETFRIPSYISKKDGIKKLGRCFRDQDELPTSSNLADNIVDALENSQWLIVICTPALSESKWCLTEIETFIKLHGRDRVLAVLAEGEPGESFPSLLRFETLDDGTVVEREPLAADIRGQMKKKLKIEKLRLIAPMLGVGFDDLRRRARERFMKTVVAASLAVVVFFAGFGSITLMQSVEIAKQRDIARENEERAIAGEAEATARRDEISAKQAKMYADFAYGIRDNNPAGAAVLALKALEYGTVDGRVLPDTSMALHYAAGLWDYTFISEKAEYRYKLAGLTAPAPVNTIRGRPMLNGDGSTFLLASEIIARLYNMKTMGVIREYNIADYVYTKKMNDGYELNLKLPSPIISKDKTKAIIPYTEPIIIDMTSGDVLYEGGLSDDILDEFGFSRYILAKNEDANTGKDTLYDRITGDIKAKWQGDTVSTRSTKIHGIFDVSIMPDNSQYFVLEEKEADGNEKLIIYEMPEMKLIYSLDLSETAEIYNYYFSPDGKHLVIILEEYSDSDYDSIEAYTGQYIILRLEDCQVIADYTINSRDKLEALHYSQNIESSFSPDGMKAILPYQYPREDWEEKGNNILANVLNLTSGSFFSEPLFSYYYIQYEPIAYSFTPDSDSVFYYDKSGEEVFFHNANNGSLLGSANVYKRYSNANVFMSGDAVALLIYHPTFAEVDWIGDSEDQYSCALYYLNAQDEVDYLSHIIARVSYEYEKRQEIFELINKTFPNKNITNSNYSIGVNETRAMISNRMRVELVDMDSGKSIFDRELAYSIASDATGYKHYDLSDISANASRFIIGQFDTLYCYDATDGALIYEKQMDLGRLKSVGISPDGETIFVLSDKGVLVFLGAEDGTEITRHYYPNLGMNYNDIQFRFTPDGKYLYGDKGIGSMNIYVWGVLESMGQKNGILLFEAKTGEFIAAHLVDPISASMQPDGGEIIYIDDTYTLRIPPMEETIAAVREITREYEFKLEDKLRYYLD